MYFSTRASTYYFILFQTFLCTLPLILLIVHDFGLFYWFFYIFRLFHLLFYLFLNFYTFPDFSSTFSTLFHYFFRLFLYFFQTFPLLFPTFPLFIHLLLLHYFTHRVHPTSCFTHWTVYQCMFSFTSMIYSQTFLAKISWK